MIEKRERREKNDEENIDFFKNEIRNFIRSTTFRMSTSINFVDEDSHIEC